MKNKFGSADWKKYIPHPICEDFPGFEELYIKAWELAYDHIKNIDGMPQNPYMDEAFCDTQVWIWDSCFMSLFCKYAREVFPGVETLKNFYEVLYNGKTLPVVIPPEGEPDWTGTIPGQPTNIKVHLADNPPLFAWAEYENALMSGDKEYIKDLLYNKKFLQKHYEWFESLKKYEKIENVRLATNLISEELGYKWEGGCSGMDNTPRGRKGEHAIEFRPNNPDMLWIDAICQQTLSAEYISAMFELLGDKGQAEYWHKKYEDKKEIINRFYWDSEDEFYYDIDCKTHDFYKVKTIASYWPLMADIAGKERAQKLVDHAKNPNEFGGKVPLVSLSRDDADYCENGKYWRGSIWLPNVYSTLKGMVNYGFYDEAYDMAVKIVDHMYRTYLDVEPHTIWECYAPEYAKPGGVQSGSGNFSRPDFCGWSALGPISVYIEFVLGFHKIDAFAKKIVWKKPTELKGKVGIKNLKFGNVVTDIEACGNICKVTSNESYTLEINGNSYDILSGENEITLVF